MAKHGERKHWLAGSIRMGFAYVRGQNKSEFCWLHHTGKKGQDNCHRIAHNTHGNWMIHYF